MYNHKCSKGQDLKLPCDNCAVFGCGSCQRTKEIGIWKLTASKGDANKERRKDWLNEITKPREMDHILLTMVGVNDNA